jgi:hypothetical protein
LLATGVANSGVGLTLGLRTVLLANNIVIMGMDEQSANFTGSQQLLYHSLSRSPQSLLQIKT